MDDTYYDGHDELYHHAKLVEDRTTRAGCRCENVVFVFLFVCLFLGRLPKVDLIILEGGMSVRPSVHKKFLRFQ